MEKKFHSSTLKKSIRISTSPEKAWTNISKIAQLQWLDGIKSSKFLSEKTRGIGATRRISFLDGTIVKEIVVGWRPKNYFSYIAVSGLPLRGYHATISIINKKNRLIKILIFYLILHIFAGPLLAKSRLLATQHSNRSIG